MLQNIFDIEKKEVNNKKKLLKEINNQRKIYDLEKEIENTITSNCLNSETDESLDHHPKNLISSIKIMRSKLDIHNILINSEDQLNELVKETKVKLEELQENERDFMDEIGLAKDSSLLNGFLNESYDAQKKCSEVVGLVERLTSHAKVLAYIKTHQQQE